MGYLYEPVLYEIVEEKYNASEGAAKSAYSEVLDTMCEMPRADVVAIEEHQKIASELQKAQHQIANLRNQIAYIMKQMEKEKTEASVYDARMSIKGKRDRFYEGAVFYLDSMINFGKAVQNGYIPNENLDSVEG